MIHEVDRAVGELLRREARERSDFGLSLDPPTAGWAGRRTFYHRLP